LVIKSKFRARFLGEVISHYISSMFPLEFLLDMLKYIVHKPLIGILWRDATSKAMQYFLTVLILLRFFKFPAFRRNGGLMYITLGKRHITKRTIFIIHLCSTVGTSRQKLGENK